MAIARRPGRPHNLTNCAVAALLLVAAGCAPGGYEPHRLAADSALPPSSTPLSQRVLLIGDNQVQHLSGKGIVERTSAADRAAGTAIRPVQLDMFAHQLLIDACEAVPQIPIIHLGDAANAACLQELERAFELMRRCGPNRPWVMAPGNHDGFLMGSVDRPCRVEEWNHACYDAANPGDHRLTKDLLVERILRETWLPSSGGDFTVACLESAEDGFDGCRAGIVQRPAGQRASGSHPRQAILVEARFRIDREARWKSYVLQTVDLSAFGQSTPVHGLILDTVHFEHPPTLLRAEADPGRTGSLGEPQRKQLETILSPGSETAYLLVGHHPLAKLQKDSRDFVLRLAKNPRVAGYISGHTHLGRWEGHAVDGRKGDLVELNVGSITDHPHEYRDLQLMAATGRESAILLLRSNINPGRTPPRCAPRFYPAPDTYLAYRKTPMLRRTHLQRHLLHTQAYAWIHFLQHSGFKPANDTSYVQLRRALALPPSHAGDEALRKATSAIFRAVDEDMNGRSPGDPVLEQQRAYMRCVAYDAARYEGRIGPREIQKRIHCASPLDLLATADPFTQRTEVRQVAVLSSAGKDEDHE